MRVGLAQFIYESNTFNPKLAEWDCFTEQGTWLTDPGAIRQWSSQAETQMSGSLRVLAAAGVETHPVWVAVCGTPGGRLSQMCYDEVKRTWVERLGHASAWDALILHLHGAVCAEGVDDVEGDLLAMVRDSFGFAGKIVLSLDLHANVTPNMLAQVDVVTGYRTAPHEDFAETGERAAKLLLGLAESASRTLAKVAVLIPPTSTHHRTGPFAEMLKMARELETEDSILDVSLFPVQPWLDVAGLGTSVVVSSKEPAAGERAARRLAKTWYAQRLAWRSELGTWREILAVLAAPTREPWFLVDTADATSGGSPGSSAAAVAQLWPHRHELNGEVLLWVVDADAVSQVAAGKSEVLLGSPPVVVDGSAEFFESCSFCPRGRAYRGQEVSCGRAATITAGCLRIVVTEAGCLTSDPAFYEALGLSPSTALAVHVKTLLGWQAGYEVALERGLYFDGPGLTSLDFAKLPFTGDRCDLFPINANPPQPIKLWQSS